MPAHAMLSRRSFLAGVAASLAGCTTARDAVVAEGGGITAAAPEYRVGDRWTYRATNALPKPVAWDETHEVVALGPDGIRVKITRSAAGVETAREESWPAPGLVSVGALYDAETRRFSEPLRRYDFPLAPGKSWSQRIGNFNAVLLRDGEIERAVRVGGSSRVTTPAGTFDALELRVMMRLDDRDYTRSATECRYVTWYAPAVRNFVREEREARYFDNTAYPTSDPVRTQRAVLELATFTAGR
jgi:hypothetical protein